MARRSDTTSLLGVLAVSVTGVLWTLYEVTQYQIVKGSVIVHGRGFETYKTIPAYTSRYEGSVGMETGAR
jgi:hypothetical protein